MTRCTGPRGAQRQPADHQSRNAVTAERRGDAFPSPRIAARQSGMPALREFQPAAAHRRAGRMWPSGQRANREPTTITAAPAVTVAARARPARSRSVPATALARSSSAAFQHRGEKAVGAVQMRKHHEPRGRGGCARRSRCTAPRGSRWPARAENSGWSERKRSTSNWFSRAAANRSRRRAGRRA